MKRTSKTKILEQPNFLLSERDLVTSIKKILKSDPSNTILIVGPAGVGKSHIANLPALKKDTLEIDDYLFDQTWQQFENKKIFLSKRIISGTHDDLIQILTYCGFSHVIYVVPLYNGRLRKKWQASLDLEDRGPNFVEHWKSLLGAKEQFLLPWYFESFIALLCIKEASNVKASYIYINKNPTLEK